MRTCCIAHLKVGSEVCVPVRLLHQLSHLPSKQVVHDAGARVVDAQPGEERLDGGRGVGGVKLLDLWVGACFMGTR
jgi:hypothetical protein